MAAAAGSARAARGPALLALAAGLLAGCSLFRVSLEPDKDPLDKQVRLSVPFFFDDTDQCGPSALASVFGYWEKPESPALLRKEIYRSGLKGSLTVDLLLAAEGRGFSAEMLAGGLPRIKTELDRGRPLIAFVDAGLSIYPVGHYLVLTGYDDKNGVFFAHSGTRRDRRISYRKFEKQWRKTEQWALLIVPARL